MAEAFERLLVGYSAIARWTLGAVFILTGAEKSFALTSFAHELRHYKLARLVPRRSLAATIAGAELVLGVILLSGFLPIVAGGGSMALASTFVIALLSVTEADAPCGCGELIRRVARPAHVALAATIFVLGGIVVLEIQGGSAGGLGSLDPVGFIVALLSLTSAWLVVPKRRARLSLLLRRNNSVHRVRRPWQPGSTPRDV